MPEEKEIEVADQDDGGWNKITVPSGSDMEVEVEEEKVEEVQAKPEPEPAPPLPKPDEPELEGIETQGAEKRIRKLIRQRNVVDVIHLIYGIVEEGCGNS